MLIVLAALTLGTATSDHPQGVRWNGAGSVMGYRTFEFKSPVPSQLEVEFAPWGTAGTLEVWLDEVGGKGHQLGSLSIPEGANDAWQTNAIDVRPTVGRHDLFFRFASSAKGEIAHVRTFQFQR